MSRRRNRERNRLTAVSFFAFQDIITALAGALLIIVLLLSYGKQGSEITENSSGIARSEYDLLVQAVELKRASLARNQKQIDTLLQQLNARRSGEAALKINRQLKNIANEAENAIRQMQLERKKLQEELTAVMQQAADTDPEVKEKLKQLDRIRNLTRQLQDKENSFRADPSGKKQFLLLDCSQQRWRWSSRSGEVVNLGRADDPTCESALQELLAKLDKCNRSDSCLIVTVRPAAGGFARSLIELVIQKYPQLEIIAEPLVSESAGGIVL